MTLVDGLASPGREAACPKRMVFGPCGGVRADLSCEMAPHPCPFADRPDLPSWPEAQSAQSPPSELLDAAARGPVILTDLTLPAFDAAALVAITSILRDSCDALLVGEHQNRPDFPPTLMAGLIRSAGGRPWLTLTCRDRNRLVLEQELQGLRVAGADGVLCVTGDGRAPGIRPGVTQVFDLDGTRLTAMAAAAGLSCAVPEAPDAPPVALRPERLLSKQRAGARLAVLNHVGTPERAQDFVRRAREVGVTLPIIAGVAVYTDARSAAVLQNFPGLQVETAAMQRVLDASDQVQAGIDAAVAEAESLLCIDGVAGVNLSGLASAQGELVAAEIKATIGERIRSQR
jgi:methylenetetrahydrofolate reductase (NADPH)